MATYPISVRGIFRYSDIGSLPSVPLMSLSEEQPLFVLSLVYKEHKEATHARPLHVIPKREAASF